MTDISNINRERVIKRWKKEEEKYLLNIKNKNTKKDLAIKSRLLGYIAGDGSINSRDNTHDIRFYPDDEKMLNIFINDFEYFYIKKPKIKKEKNYFKTQITHKFAGNDLLSLSKLGTLNWEIPQFIFDDKKYLKEWLKAFFDCEAYVGKKQIQLQSVNEKGIYQIQEALLKFDIESRIYRYIRKNNKNWNDNYLISIMKKKSRLNYLKEIGFNHLRKEIKLNQILFAKIE